MEERPGTVVEIHGMRATVLLHDDGERLRCRPLRDRRQLAVGDRVRVTEDRRGPEVSELLERSRMLWRPVDRGRRVMAAHVDRVMVVVSVDPPPSPGLLDRFLVATEAADIETWVLLNKIDLPGRQEADGVLDPYRELDYKVLEVSARSGQGLEEVALETRRGLTVFAGHSGVGKSSILNTLIPEAALPVGELSSSSGRGRHTTSVTTCHRVGDPWPEGGLVVDTPGVRAFGLYGFDLSEIGRGFRDIRQHSSGCRFRNCLHEAEPDCAVRHALQAGGLDPGRYARYQALVESVRRGDG